MFDYNKVETTFKNFESKLSEVILLTELLDEKKGELKVLVDLTESIGDLNKLLDVVQSFNTSKIDEMYESVQSLTEIVEDNQKGLKSTIKTFIDSSKTISKDLEYSVLGIGCTANSNEGM